MATILDTATQRATVFVVDDDPDVRRSVALLVRLIDLLAEPFVTPHEFLELFDPNRPGCLVVDMRMPGMSGLELQNELNARNIAIPLIFISAHRGSLQCHGSVAWRRSRLHHKTVQSPCSLGSLSRSDRDRSPDARYPAPTAKRERSHRYPHCA
ncbi:MAG: response regulator [Phycisphaera sp. RhM]|nr:response regulator [Phycisphaera sp. RhM]